MRVQFMQDVAVDIEQIAAVAALSDPMKIPNFVEQSPRHCVATGVFLPMCQYETRLLCGASIKHVT
jgi:hypothetical protein